MTRKAPGLYSEIYRDLYREKYHVMQYVFTQFFVEHLDRRVPDIRSGSSVGARPRDCRASRASGPRSGHRDAWDGPEPRTNCSSIAEVSGIPRETVRRKLGGLARRGWAERDAKGQWRITYGQDSAPARRDLRDLDQRSIERISRMLGNMHELAVEARAKSSERA